MCLLANRRFATGSTKTRIDQGEIRHADTERLCVVFQSFSRQAFPRSIQSFTHLDLVGQLDMCFLAGASLAVARLLCVCWPDCPGNQARLVKDARPSQGSLPWSISECKLTTRDSRKRTPVDGPFMKERRGRGPEKQQPKHNLCRPVGRNWKGPNLTT